MNQVVTFASPLVKTASSNTPKIVTSISKSFNNLLKNTGVKLGVGLGATAGGLGLLNHQAKEVTNPLGIEGSSTILVIGIVIIVLLFLVRARR